MPQRTKPVSRDEIRCSWDIQTMPASSMRKNRDGKLEPIPKLWATLLRSLDQERKETWESWPPQLQGDPPEPVKVPEPYDKCFCRQCGRVFYKADKGARQNGGVMLYCSDKCVAVAHAAAMAPIVKARSEARAKARAGRKCETCGKAIKAQRSTMKFCSVRCRVASHRASQQTASD
jgi:hypothetical protein